MIRANEKLIFKIFYSIIGGVTAIAILISLLIYFLSSDNDNSGSAILALSIMCIVIDAIFLFVIILIKVLTNKPEQKVRATLLEKGIYGLGSGRRGMNRPYVILAFADGTRKRFNAASWKFHKLLPENASGEFYYKELADGKCLVAFDPDVSEPVEISLEQTPAEPINTTNTAVNVYADNQNYFFGFAKKDSTYYKSFKILFSILIVLYAIVFIGMAFRSLFHFFVFSVTGLIIFFEIMIKRNKKNKIEKAPEQKIKATVVHKKMENRYHSQKLHFVTFLLQASDDTVIDETKKIIPVSISVYTTLVSGDTGMLTFKENGKHILFVSFEGMRI